MVGGHRVTDLYQNPSAVNRLYRSWFGLDSLEEGRKADVGRRVVPGVQRSGLTGNRVPTWLSEDVLISKLEHFRSDYLINGRADFVVTGPDVREHHWFTRLSVTKGVAREIDIESTSEGVGHHERRTCEIVRLDFLVNPTLEVSVSRENTTDDQFCLVYSGLYLLIERS